jgi:Arc/MetJ family transcription regulator
MRTTITLDDDVSAEVERLRRETGVGASEAVNQLIRAGMSNAQPRFSYEHRSADVGLKVDVTNVAAVLDLLDDE